MANHGDPIILPWPPHRPTMIAKDHMFTLSVYLGVVYSYLLTFHPAHSGIEWGYHGDHDGVFMVG